MPAESAYTVAVDGPGVTLESVDPIEAMSVAIEYLRLVGKVAQHLGTEVVFTGFKAVPGSAGVQTDFGDAMAIAPVLAMADRLVQGEEFPPKELRTATKAVQDVLWALPEGHFAKTGFGPATRMLTPRLAPAPPVRFEYISLRAEAVNVGGADTPRAKFREPSEGTISVEVTEDQAREIGSQVYKLLDISLRVARNYDGKIEDASLISFDVVESGDAWPAWKQWFRQNASRWDDVENVESALNGEDGR